MWYSGECTFARPYCACACGDDRTTPCVAAALAGPERALARGWARHASTRASVVTGGWVRTEAASAVAESASQPPCSCSRCRSLACRLAGEADHSATQSARSASSSSTPATLALVFEVAPGVGASCGALVLSCAEATVGSAAEVSDTLQWSVCKSGGQEAQAAEVAGELREGSVVENGALAQDNDVVEESDGLGCSLQ